MTLKEYQKELVFQESKEKKDKKFMRSFLSNYNQLEKKDYKKKEEMTEKRELNKAKSIQKVYDLARNVINITPYESNKAIKKMIKLAHQPNYHSKRLAKKMLSHTLKTPLIFNQEDKHRALRAIDRCYQRCQSDQVAVYQKYVKYMTWLKQSNIKEVRQKAEDRLKELKKRPQTYGEAAIERALMAVERLKEKVLMGHKKGNQYFLRLLNLANSCSPTVMQEAKWAVDICLSQKIRAK